MTWVVAIIGSVAGFLFGYDEGIIAGSLELVKIILTCLQDMWV